MKVSPSSYELKHYKDGEFNKDYDRKDTVKVSFLKMTVFCSISGIIVLSFTMQQSNAFPET